MKRAYQIGFILFFLAIIGAVPVVQTCYELATNPGRRIQMLDLPVDLFVSPTKKAVQDAAAIENVQRIVERLRNEAASGTTDSGADHRQLVSLCDEAKIEISLLARGVVDYNRHLQGETNAWAARDTLTPYSRSLAAAGALIDTLLPRLPAAREGGSIVPLVNELSRKVAAAQSGVGDPGGVLPYVKRTLKAFRRIMVGADYLRPYEKEMEKVSVFANAIRPWMLTARYALFGDLGSKGIRGRNGWLFYRPDVDYLVKPYVLDPRSRIVDPNDVPVADHCIDTIVSFRNRLASRGIDLLFVIMPTKPSIYPDLLNGRIDAGESGRLTHSLRMLRELAGAGIETVDLFSAFAGERKNDATAAESLYLRTDTHFRERGVRATARAVADRIKRYPWYADGATEYAVDTVTVMRSGDIAEMIGLPKSVKTRFPRLFEPEATRCSRVCRIVRDERGGAARRIPYKDDYVNSSILVLGDSFSRIYQTDPPRGAGWIAHLALELKQPLASLVNDGGASTLVREMLARKQAVLKGKKLVVWEVVERDFRFGEKGWKDVQPAKE